MEEAAGIQRHHVFIVAIVAIVIVAALALGFSQIIQNPFENPGIEPDESSNITYEGNATFVLPSGNVTFKCEIADNATERATGLMYRESVEEDAGMLFVFDYEVQASFWMKNTLIPLDIIFINKSGYVTNIEQADPEPGVHDYLLERYLSNGPILWVLEINQGKSAEFGITAGTYVELEY